MTDLEDANAADRAKKVDQYVVAEALALLILNAAGHFTESVGEDGRAILDEVATFDVSLENLAHGIPSGFNELWPDDPDVETAEFKLASIRAELLAAEFCYAFSRSADLCRTIGDHYVHVAKQAVGELEREAQQ